MTPSSSPFPSLSPSPESSCDRDELLSVPGFDVVGAAEDRRHNAVTANPRFDPGLASSSTDGPLPSNKLPSPDAAVFASATDGLTERLFRSKTKGPIAAIFIHAGAGFHSTTNEHVHLEACSEAARLAMKFLKAGGTAVDAVEAAIKCLEDKEITNAGYGSNLSIDGVVEGDATIVDHLGRSGACGSAQMIKNPISLARLIYDRSNIPLSLRRIPPNILVGHGAAQFAQEHGMRLIPHQQLISKGAQDRFYRWRQDLINAEEAAIRCSLASGAASKSRVDPQSVPGGPPGACPGMKSVQNAQQIAVSGPTVTASITSGSSQPPDDGRPAGHLPAYGKYTQASLGTTTVKTETSSSTAAGKVEAWPARNPKSSHKRFRLGDYDLFSNDEAATRRKRRSSSGGDGSFADEPVHKLPSISGAMSHPLDHFAEGTAADEYAAGNPFRYAEIGLHDNDTDIITDTIGAIAIDLRGNIAAGSSSGGIGMKHSGRIGPAALVGIGTAVIPADPKDSRGTSVAAVTSGTGEHMATTMASHTCAQRLYHGNRRTDGGSFDTEYDDDAIMKSFVTDDFMNHPGVRNQISGGAIGVMAAKKTNRGVYFYFAHNTDSFALASLSSNEDDPLVVISRLGPRESVARGGRKIKRN
ncbi:taspase, threonineeeee aspartase, 1 [Sporothrix brasiliensis 5110]|uniref:Taspase, threonineeeee aspartase, 1 n=1 Tax=Sporothrix brasiliensis 5110 TaxID=1398154 RepID=A0A0C2FDN6_9PEZI|nr:taspase, threonineeeee aspartase, 1 [Sporothrix brasiliensis 5110]KIH89228.1 taspase, threonineeeee aspartase, 1 [Sporothrix brasiliensis 5110]